MVWQAEQGLQERLTHIAVQVMELRDQLPMAFAGCHLGEQLFRSGIAAAANYAEARGGESRSDFSHKLGVVRKELNESLVWLRMIERRSMGPVERDPTEAL